MSSIQPTRLDVEHAFSKYNSGERPRNFGNAKWQYVFDGNGRLYPAKQIWALAIKSSNPKDFTSDGAKSALFKLGFHLQDIRNLPDADNNFEQEVATSVANSPEVRRHRLSSTPPKPQEYYQIIKTKRRNPDVVAEVLFLANGHCQNCNQKAPFNKKSDGTPYLEVHHIVFLSNEGDDTVENAQALCPNCHRERHHG